MRQARALRERSPMGGAAAQNAPSAIEHVEQLDRERRRIAAALYDGPAQLLGYALLRLDELGDRDPDRLVSGGPDALTAQLAEARDAVDAALAELCSLAAGLRTPELSTLCVEDVVQRALRDARRAGSVDVAIQDDGLPCDAPLASRILVYHIVRDAVPMVGADGQTAKVRLRADPAQSTLSVAVTGSGLSPDSLSEARARLRFHATWSDLLSGSCAVEQRRVRGAQGTLTITVVRAVLPI